MKVINTFQKRNISTAPLRLAEHVLRMITNVGERDVWRQLGRVEELLTLLAARLGAERAEPDDAPGARKRRPKVHFVRYRLTPFLKTG